MSRLKCLKSCILVNDASTCAINDMIATFEIERIDAWHHTDALLIDKMVCFISQIAVYGDMRARFEEIVDVLVHRHTSLLCDSKWEIGIVRMNLHSKRLSYVCNALCNPSETNESKPFTIEFCPL